jgi:hypothetical protein
VGEVTDAPGSVVLGAVVDSTGEFETDGSVDWVVEVEEVGAGAVFFVCQFAHAFELELRLTMHCSLAPRPPMQLSTSGTVKRKGKGSIKYLTGRPCQQFNSRA